MRTSYFIALLGVLFLLVGCPPGDDDDDTSGDDDVGDDDTSGDDDAGLTDCLYYRDTDGDGYGDPADEMLWSCDGPPEEYVDNNEDCDDDDPDIYPGAEEFCDGIDNDCDGAEDEDLPLYECHTDGDGDGYGETGGLVVVQCECGAGSSAEATDCVDTNADVYPGAPDVCDDVLDNDCDGATDPGEEDDDGDGFSECLGDCDDTDASLNLDDLDADGVDTCSGDCDDDDETLHPGAAEVCDGLDNNCNGSLPADEADGDLDGYMVCENDCDDTNDLVHPGAPDTCDSVLDNNCDGTTDTMEADADGDGWSNCTGDCDDGDSSTNPGASEVCNDGLDNDCDGTDNGCSLAGIIDLASADAKLTGESTEDRVGKVKSLSAGDVDGDGLLDILVGGYWNDAGGEDAGAGYLVMAPVAGAFALSGSDAKLVGEEASDWAGTSVAFAGDVDGDSIGDVLIGATRSDVGGADAGAAYLLYGPIAGTVDLSSADAVFVGEQPEDQAGWVSVASPGDVNNDGYADILVGAHGVDDGVEFGEPLDVQCRL